MSATLPWFCAPLAVVMCLPLPWLLGRMVDGVARRRSDADPLADASGWAPKATRHSWLLLVAAFALAAGALLAQ
jgi:hypothetical protein